MRYLRTNEIEEVKKLRAQGWKFKDIAGRFMVCEATVSNIVNGKSSPRRLKHVDTSVRSPYAAVDFKEEDFSQYPDTVLFQHVRVWDFTG